MMPPSNRPIAAPIPSDIRSNISDFSSKKNSLKEFHQSFIFITLKALGGIFCKITSFKNDGFKWPCSEFRCICAPKCFAMKSICCGVNE